MSLFDTIPVPLPMSSLRYTEPDEAVQSGMAYLDELMPGWWKHIDLVLLDISADNTCILGQLDAVLRGMPVGAGSYTHFATMLHLNTEWAVTHGFTLHNPIIPYSAIGRLNCAWRLAIRARRGESDESEQVWEREYHTYMERAYRAVVRRQIVSMIQYEFMETAPAPLEFVEGEVEHELVTV